MKIGITGHQNIENPEWVASQINLILNRQSQPFTGVTSLAIGADQIFANEVLKHKMDIEVIIPFASYEEKFTTSKGVDEYKRLLKLAISTLTLEKKDTDEEGYYEAGKKIVDIADLMIAVWNEKPAKGLGGTADIVKYAKEKNKKIIIINPETQQLL